MVVPSPTCPFSFSPQAQSEPSAFKATESYLLPATATQSEVRTDACGDVRVGGCTVAHPSPGIGSPGPKRAVGTDG